MSRKPLSSGKVHVPSTLSSVFDMSPQDALNPSTNSSRVSRRGGAKSLPALLPVSIQLGNYHVTTITRRKAEESLLIGSVVLVIWRLHFEMGASREALGKESIYVRKPVSGLTDLNCRTVHAIDLGLGVSSYSLYPVPVI
jgi:hypothetical protein